MRLSTKGRYAVMAMVDLARNAADRPTALSDIAARQEISLSYLEQLFSRMRRAGLVKSVRGPGGGYMLTRPAMDVKISEIVVAVDEPLRVPRCSPETDRGCMSDGSRCVAHDLWEELGNQILDYLSSVSLDDVCHRRLGNGAARLAGTPSSPCSPSAPCNPCAPMDEVVVGLR